MTMGSQPMGGGRSQPDDAVQSVLDLIAGGGQAVGDAMADAGDGIADFLSGANDWRKRNRAGLLNFAQGQGQGLGGLVSDAAGAVQHQRDHNETEQLRRMALEQLGLGHLMAGPESAPPPAPTPMRAPQRPVVPAGQAPERPGAVGDVSMRVAGAGGGGGVLDALKAGPAGAALSPQTLDALRRRLAQGGAPRAAY